MAEKGNTAEFSMYEELQAELEKYKQREIETNQEMSTLRACIAEQAAKIKELLAKPNEPLTWIERVKPKAEAEIESDNSGKPIYNAEYATNLPTFENNLEKFGKYENRPDKTESAMDFTKRAWGKYLDCFNGGQGDYIYLDEIRKLDESLAIGFNNWFRGKTGKASDFIPDKSSRVQKQMNELLEAVRNAGGDLPIKQKLYLLQRAIANKQERAS